MAKLHSTVIQNRDQLEEWRACKETPFYEVSSLGRIRSLARRVRCGPPPGTREIRAMLMNPTLLNTGYLQVKLHGKKYSIHRLVAAAFLEGKPRETVNHKNGVRDDNRLENLEWATRSENLLHASRVLGTMRGSTGKFGLKHPCGKPITYRGTTKSAEEWAKERGWKTDVIYGRVRLGWPIERILTQPPGTKVRAKA